MLGHGSISFGRFEFEPLSWEKWSVFTHDRRQEEMEKFNGLVAEKKAYFEEYYKNMRALKVLQQSSQPPPQQHQNLQTELSLDYSDGSNSSQDGGEDEPMPNLGVSSSEIVTGTELYNEKETLVGGDHGPQSNAFGLDGRETTEHEIKEVGLDVDVKDEKLDDGFKAVSEAAATNRKKPIKRISKLKQGPKSIPKPPPRPPPHERKPISKISTAASISKTRANPAVRADTPRLLQRANQLTKRSIAWTDRATAVSSLNSSTLTTSHRAFTDKNALHNSNSPGLVRQTPREAGVLSDNLKAATRTSQAVSSRTLLTEKRPVAPSAGVISKPAISRYVKEVPILSLNSKRIELQTSGKPRSSSINLPPSQKSRAVSESHAGTSTSSRIKEVNRAAAQPRVAERDVSATVHNKNIRARGQKAPPSILTAKSSRVTMNKPQESSLVNSRKPKIQVSKWH